MSRHDFSARTKARSRAVDVLFEAHIKGLDDPPGLYGLAQERRVESVAQTPIPPFAQKIVEGVAEHLDLIDRTLATYAQGWSLGRMPKVDLAILRMGCWEVLFNEDVDGMTAISEAMKIARQKSTDESPRFINGLLAKINDLRQVILSNGQDAPGPQAAADSAAEAGPDAVTSADSPQAPANPDFAASRSTAGEQSGAGQAAEQGMEQDGMEQDAEPPQDEPALATGAPRLDAGKLLESLDLDKLE